MEYTYRFSEKKVTLRIFWPHVQKLTCLSESEELLLQVRDLRVAEVRQRGRRPRLEQPRAPQRAPRLGIVEGGHGFLRKRGRVL
jgi:hypothetical protein